MSWWGVLVLIALVGLVAYWLLVVTEGAYLGPRVVVALYDRFAGRYDSIKQFEPRYEALFLGVPLSRWLAEEEGAWLLDVATGTGRLPAAVLEATDGRLHVVALDRSLPMLRQAQVKLSAWPSVCYVQHDAEDLPFVDTGFDVVACIEALEFMPRPGAVVTELWRVLSPGGLLVLSNRIGWQSRLMPGRTYGKQQLVTRLRSLGSQDVQVLAWQVDYDLVMASKPGKLDPARPRQLVDLLACTGCGASQLCMQTSLSARCGSCERTFHDDQGVWRLHPVK